MLQRLKVDVVIVRSIGILAQSSLLFYRSLDKATNTSNECPSKVPEAKEVDDVYQLYADLSNVIFEGCKMKTLSPQSTSSKLEEDSKVPQMESAIQVPAAEVNIEVSVRICGVDLEMML